MKYLLINIDYKNRYLIKKKDLIINMSLNISKNKIYYIKFNWFRINHRTYNKIFNNKIYKYNN